jgi:hypothetical protein
MAGRQLREIPEGIRGKLNNTGSDIAAHMAVKLDSTVDQIALVGATTDHVFGVTHAIIADGAYGDIVTRGQALVLSGAAMATIGVLTMADATGRAIAWSAAGGTNANVLGTLLTTASGAAELVEIELAGPGVINQG